MLIRLSYWLFGGILLLAGSCTTTHLSDEEVPYPGDRIVLQAFLSEQDGIIAVIAKTLPPGDTGDPVLKNPQVIVWENGSIIDTLKEHSDGIYRSSPWFHARTGAYYKLTITADDVPEASTPEILTEPVVPFDSLSFVNETGYLPIVYYHIKDIDPVEKNMFVVNTQIYDSTGMQLFYYPPKTALPFDLIGAIGEQEIGSNGISGVQQVPREIWLENNTLVDVHKAKVNLFSFSEPVIRFAESYFKDEGVRYLAWYDPLPVDNNIINGFGFWGAYSVSSAVFTVE